MQENMTRGRLRIGLSQIPDDGLRRLIEHVEGGGDVLLDGNIYVEGVG